MVCYLVYRRKHPELHEKSIYKMPGGIVMAWTVIVFFVVSVVILCFDPETLQAVIVTPVWFILLGICYLVYRSRHGSQRTTHYQQ